MRPPFQLPASVRGFHDYFKLNAESDEVIAAFGYSYLLAELTLPRLSAVPSWVDGLRARLLAYLPRVAMTGETARREFMIAPVLLEVAQHRDVQLRAEYAIRVSAQLKGTLDYLLLSQRDLLVVEAKQGDSERGFTQLAAELIALDQWMTPESPTLYGALSWGAVWQFALLERAEKVIRRDLHLYTVPDDLEALACILEGIVSEDAPGSGRRAG